LGRALRATKSAGDRGAEECYVSALHLCDRLGTTPTERFPIVFGLWSCYAGRGAYDRASDAVALLKDLAPTGRADVALEAAHAEWSTCIASGQAVAGLRSVERSRRIVAQGPDVSWWKHGTHDPVVCSHQMSALAHWLLGSYKAARSDAAQAVRIATGQRHPFSTVLAHHVAAVVYFHCGDHGSAMFHARTASSLGRFHGVTGVPQHAALIAARLLAGRGEVAEALELVDANLPEALSAGWPWTSSISVGLSAEIYGLAGQPARGIGMLRSLDPHRYAGMYGPELHRLCAKLLLMDPESDTGEAEGHFESALEHAREKQLKALRLRAAIDFATHLAKRSRSAARAALSVIDEFDEMADAEDLRKGPRAPQMAGMTSWRQVLHNRSTTCMQGGGTHESC
jgi:hypothetical protein